MYVYIVVQDLLSTEVDTASDLWAQDKVTVSVTVAVTVTVKAKAVLRPLRPLYIAQQPLRRLFTRIINFHITINITSQTTGQRWTWDLGIRRNEVRGSLLFF